MVVRKKKTQKRHQPASKVRAGGFFWPLLLRTLLAICFCFIGLIVYLDYQIQQSFDQGVHPQPAHIYGRGALFGINGNGGKSQLVKTLDKLGYRRVDQISGPGSYVVAGERMDLYTNIVESQPGQPNLLRLEFRGDTLTQILNHQDASSLQQIVLEAPLIGSLQLGPYEDRIALKLHQMPELLIKALLAMEDRNFESHFGIDFVAIARALTNNLFKGDAIQGGSTITQQLVKNLFLSPERSLSRKVVEALMAVTMELRYSKSEILEHYLNEIFLGQAGNRAVHGFALASEYYFARPLSQLKLNETALLVGMIPAPSLYNPRRHPKRAKARRDLVIRTLARVNAITETTATYLIAQPVEIAPLAATRSERFPAYVDYLHRQIRQYFSEKVLRRDGLKLFTTLDPAIQQHAQSALTKSLINLENKHGIESGKLQSAAIIVDVGSGDIVALVGDRKKGYSGFNRAIDAQRPIGSLIKPFVYLTALEQPKDFSLATLIEDTPLTLNPPGGKPWSPQNYDKTFRGTANVLDSLTRSYNVPTVRVGLQVGVNNVIETLNRLGIKRPIRDYPSLLLGANDHSPLEVAQLYQPIANHGTRIPLRSISRISDRRGRVIARFPSKQQRVVEPGPAYLIDYALKQVVRRGTAAALGSRFSPALQLAGKTGTTDDYRDSWFAGYSGNFLTVVWVGRDDNGSIGLTGSNGAMRVWQQIMAGFGLAPGKFDPPADIEFVEIDPSSGLLARNNCPDRISIPVIDSAPIRRYAPCAGVIGRIQSWFNIEDGSSSGDVKVQERSINKAVSDQR